jgi:hypothetical protein
VRNFFLRSKATAEVPIKVAVQYSHRFAIAPDNTAGQTDIVVHMATLENKERKKTIFRFYCSRLFHYILFYGYRSTFSIWPGGHLLREIYP